ncbi:MAG: D-2-hydroxyacid dehydrogenase [Dehalococcoidia bacterium]|nr:D-2-hydroxyacid dehydrogenase [Dehalococcoidia bacterium]
MKTDANKQLRIVVTIPMNEVLVRRVIDVGARITITSVFDIMYEDMGGDAAAKERLDYILSEAEIIYGYGLPNDVIARSPKLKWVQMTSTAVDKFLTDDLRRSSVVMTNVRGMHSVPVGEFVISQMLMFAKGAHRCFQQKQGKQWKPFMPLMLYAKTVGIVGLGNIGRQVARLSKSLGMRVLGVRRSEAKSKTTKYVDEIFPRRQLKKMLNDCDFVVLTVPLTAETENMIGEAELRSMKPTAYLINVSRGNVVNEDALVNALENNRIAGAGMDVFAVEPLPPGSRLWDLSNVMLSPHIAGGMECYAEQATDIFCENLRRYMNGQKLLRTVDKKKGY